MRQSTQPARDPSRRVRRVKITALDFTSAPHFAEVSGSRIRASTILPVGAPHNCCINHLNHTQRRRYASSAKNKRQQCSHQQLEDNKDRAPDLVARATTIPDDLIDINREMIDESINMRMIDEEIGLEIAPAPEPARSQCALLPGIAQEPRDCVGAGTPVGTSQSCGCCD